jgi:hypothetical protein
MVVSGCRRPAVPPGAVATEIPPTCREAKMEKVVISWGISRNTTLALVDTRVGCITGSRPTAGDPGRPLLWFPRLTRAIEI